MMALFAKINPGVIWLLIAIATDVLSTFYSAKGNGLVNKLDQGIALVLYMISFACAAYALKFMQAGILYVLWSGIGVIATALLAKAFLGQSIDWLDGSVSVLLPWGSPLLRNSQILMFKKKIHFILLLIGNLPSISLQIDR